MPPLLLTTSMEAFVNFHRGFLFGLFCFQQVTKYCTSGVALGTRTGKWRSGAAAAKKWENSI